MPHDVSQDVTTAQAHPAAANSTAQLAAVLACPTCGSTLVAQSCATCDVQYPTLGTVPWLFPNPVAHQCEWRNRWHLALRQLQARAQAAIRASERTASAATRNRLTQLAAGYSAQQEAVRALLAPLDIGLAATRETYLALQTPLPEHHGLFSYAPNVFRDWGWGAVENRGALNTLLGTLETHGTTSVSRIAVLGSGAGRLAYDLHTALAPALTVGIEINPYLAFAAARICAGACVALTEFPMAPKTAADVAITHSLRCPDPESSAGLRFLAADALAPPLQHGSFDLVVTPWFADVCGATPAQLASQVNALLQDEGQWLNHGSVAFAGPEPEDHLSLEEFVEQVTACGFSKRASVDVTLPYLQSPGSRHGRVESVNTTLFARSSACPAPAQHPLAEPPWLLDPTLAVPQSDAFRLQTNTTAIHAFLMSLIDGERSIEAMAQVLEARGMMPAPDAQQALGEFLRKMQAEAQAG